MYSWWRQNADARRIWAVGFNLRSRVIIRAVFSRSGEDLSAAVPARGAQLRHPEGRQRVAFVARGEAGNGVVALVQELVEFHVNLVDNLHEHYLHITCEMRANTEMRVNHTRMS